MRVLEYFDQVGMYATIFHWPEFQFFKPFLIGNIFKTWYHSCKRVPELAHLRIFILRYTNVLIIIIIIIILIIIIIIIIIIITIDTGNGNVTTRGGLC